MTDRELLEAAAKASYAELPVDYLYSLDKGIWCGFCDRPYIWWNPISNNGDALWLAVKLKITVSMEDKDICAWRYIGPDFYCAEPIGDDAYAATRRAIVRVAAEIGKEMK